jgi:hypothetical protein
MELDTGIGAADEMLDPLRAEGARSTAQPVDFVSLRDEEFRKVGAVLACDSGDESDFHL